MGVVVPRIDSGSIAPQLGSVPQGSANTSAAGFGGDIGAALQNAAGTVSDIQYSEQQKANAAIANQSRIALANHEANQFDPNNPSGVYSYQGNKALQAPDAVKQDLDTFASNYRSTLSNPVQQQQFDQLYADHRLGVLDRVNRYALEQNNKFQEDSYQGAVGSALSSATTKAQAGDQQGAQLAIQDGVSAIQQYGDAHGQPAEFTQYSIDKFQKTVGAATEAANKANADAYILQNPQAALHDFSARLQLGQYSDASQAVSGDPSAARGVRNNNPGNIQQSDVAWQGKVPSQDPRYEAFATPESGIRALALNAQHLQNTGAQSVSDLIGKWAPAAENGQAGTTAYINDVSQAMGVQPTDSINLQDPAQLTAFTNAVITHENGKNPYSPDQVSSGVSAAMGKSKLADSHPPVTQNGSGMIVPGDGSNTPITGLKTSGNPVIDSLDTANVVAGYNRAREEVNKNQVSMRGSIEQRVVDDTAAFKTGQAVPQPLSLANFTAAYGDKDGMTKFGAYQANQQFGQDMATVGTLTPQEMTDLAAARTPAPGENFAVKQQDRDSLVNAMNTVLKIRNTDPVAWATSQNIGGLQPIDTSAPDKMASSIATRPGPVQALADQYGTPYQLLSKTEAANMGAALSGYSSKDKATFLGGLSTQLQPADYADVVNSLKKNSPTTAIAGQIMGAGRAAITTPGGIFHSATTMDAPTIAQTMLTGDALINPTKADKEENGAPKFAMPSDDGSTGLRSVWSTVVGDAYRGDGAGEEQGYQAFRSMYAGLASQQGKADGVLDPAISEQAARAVIGNVGTWGAKNVIPPYGMDFNTFKDSANAAFNAQRANIPGAEMQSASAYNLDRIGDGAYAVSNGQSPLRDKNGQPVVLRINAANPTQIRAAADRIANKGKPYPFASKLQINVGDDPAGSAPMTVEQPGESP